MQRRETRLGYWLARDSRKEMRRKPIAGIKELILHRLHAVACVTPVHTESLALEIAIRNLAEDSLAQIAIHDGLAQIRTMTDSSLIEKSISIKNKDGIAVGSIKLMEDQHTVRDIPLPHENLPRVHSAMLEEASSMHHVPLWKRDSAVRTVTFLASWRVPVKNGQRGIYKDTEIRSNMSRICAAPFLRESLDVGGLSASEYRGFLREAETMRHIPIERCELLAVFRSVPIEILSKLQYLSEKKMILYRISQDIPRTQTRLHDIAAIRDTADQEIHLVPHRAQYKMAFLKE